MLNTPRKLNSIIANEALEYALYTVENRAIPNLMDGFKPVQRFIIYRALAMARGDANKMHKLASVAGGVADAGYHHGEASAQDSGALMANTWNNNFPFLDGQGNFGSRLVQEAAASRYVFCRVSKNFHKVFKDTEIAPAHADNEHLPPRFYLPVIPTVLLNGVKGIATGYATTILPHSLESLIQATRDALEGKEITAPQVQFPEFKGDIIEVEPGKYELHGKYAFTSKTMMYISEIPYQFDRAKYIEKVLDPLEDKGFITYDDDCSIDGFGFKIKFRKEYKFPEDEAALDAKIKKDFALIEKLSQNITVIDENGKLNDKLKTASEVVQAFVKVRKGYVQQRIVHKQAEFDHVFKLSLAKALFIKEVNLGNITVKGKTRAQLKEALSTFAPFVGFEDELVSMNIYHMTDDEMEKLKQKAHEARETLTYWQNTTADIEYAKDLDELTK